MIHTGGKPLQQKSPQVLLFQNWINRKANVIAAGYVVIFLITGILTLPFFGLTWDEGLGNLFFGERYLHFFTSLNTVNLDFKAELPYNREHALNLFHAPYRQTPQEFPAVADTLAAGTMYLFSYTLGWLDPIDGFHLFTVLLAAGFLWALYRFAAPRIGKFEALLAILFLSLFPRFWGDMHFNVKDVPEAIFFSLTIMAYVNWMEKPGWRKALLTGVLCGLALGVKANAIFIPVILLIGLLPWSIHIQPWNDLFTHFKQQIGGYAIMGASAGIVYLASWPYLYIDPFHHLKSYWSYILSQGGRVGETAFNIDPIRQVFFSMPEIMLLALLIGLFVACLRLKEPFWRIVVAWLAFPILRASLPGTVNFDGIRHFLEFVPAAALVSGYGIGRATCWMAERRIGLVLTRALFTAVVAFNLLSIYGNYFPYLHTYYNAFTGGLAGARNGWLGMEAGDYWASSYRQAMNWLSQNAPEGSIVRGMTANWIMELAGPLWLRPDMQVLTQESLPDFSILAQSDRPIYLVFVIRQASHLDELAYCRERKKPVYQLSVDKVPILEIYAFGKNNE